MATTGPTENGTVEAQNPESDTSPIAAQPAEPETNPSTGDATTVKESADKKWPGWPGDCVFRLIVPVLKVGSIIGKKGDLIKKLCEETRARVRVLDGPVGSPDRIVLISGKEEPDLALSPAMDAVMRISKRVNGLPEGEEDANSLGAAAAAFCSIRLLVAASQAINLIGKQGSSIKSIQESTGASIRVLSTDDNPNFGNSEERIVEVQGEALKVLKALQAVVGHLRKFLVDHSVLPLFEKSHTPVPQDRQVETWADKPTLHTSLQTGIGGDFSLSLKRDSMFLDRESNLEAKLSSSGLSLYGQDAGISGLRSSGLGRAGGPIVTQIAQTMQIPLAFAEDIIGIGGSNIAYIRGTSGAILTVQESRGLPEEITVEIKGTAAQVQTAQQLIQESVNSRKDLAPSSYSSYGNIESDSRSSYSQLGNASSYSSSSFGGQQYGHQYGEQQYGRYGSSGLGGYGSYRM